MLTQKMLGIIQNSGEKDRELGGGIVLRQYTTCERGMRPRVRTHVWKQILTREKAKPVQDTVMSGPGNGQVIFRNTPTNQ